MPDKIIWIANLWTLVHHPSLGREWSLERKIRAIAAAGFDGITTGLEPGQRHLAEKHGLRHLIGYIAAVNPDEFATLIRRQKEDGATHINVQLGAHDTPPALGVKHWIRMERAAEKIGGVKLSLETHRGTCTETPEKAYEIAERYHRATGRLIKFTFDFSHFASVKHLAPEDYAPRLLTHPELIRHSEQFHLRPFNGHHCQAPVTHRGALTPEVKHYLAFAAKLLRIWKTGSAGADRTLFACPEMGPYREGYNMTGLPPAWPDAIVLREELAKVWHSA